MSSVMENLRHKKLANTFPEGVEDCSDCARLSGLCFDCGADLLEVPC